MPERLRYTAGDKQVLDFVGSWVLVRPDQVGREKSGLAMIESYRQRKAKQSQGWTGKVLSAGGDVDSCVGGDHIVFDSRNATELKLGDHSGELCLVIEGDDVIGHIKGKS